MKRQIFLATVAAACLSAFCTGAIAETAPAPDPARAGCVASDPSSCTPPQKPDRIRGPNVNMNTGIVTPATTVTTTTTTTAVPQHTYYHAHEAAEESPQVGTGMHFAPRVDPGHPEAKVPVSKLSDYDLWQREHGRDFRYSGQQQQPTYYQQPIYYQQQQIAPQSDPGTGMDANGNWPQQGMGPCPATWIGKPFHDWYKRNVNQPELQDVCDYSGAVTSDECSAAGVLLTEGAHGTWCQKFDGSPMRLLSLARSN